MTTINVQFSDSTEEKILSYFANAQDAKVFPHQGQVDTSDARYAEFYSSMPEFVSKGIPSPADKSLAAH